jgi:ankyrin repeat protein
MKLMKAAAAAFAVACAAQPGMAQYSGGDGYAFLKAVEERDGAKMTELVKARPTIINTRDDDGETGLMIAISRRDGDFTGYLLTHGADPTLAARNGDTALIKAARVGYYDAAHDLLRLKVPVDAANRMGETALMVAVQQRHSDLVELLLKVGADPDKTDSAAGLSARDYAKRDTRSREILALIETQTKKPAAGKLDLPKDAGDFTIKN